MTLVLPLVLANFPPERQRVPWPHRTLRCAQADAVAKRYRPWPKGLRADSLPWFDSPLVQGASRLRYTDKAQVAATGPYWPKGARNKKKDPALCPIACTSTSTCRSRPKGQAVSPVGLGHAGKKKKVRKRAHVQKTPP